MISKLAASMLAFICIALMSPAARADSSTPPHQAREVVFTYHTELTGIDPKAHKVEAWIPLPRQDGFQTVSDLGIDGPPRTEVIVQPAGGNRVAHFSLSGVPPAVDSGYDPF